MPRRTSLVRNLRRPWASREHSLESTEKGKTEPPCAVTLAKCRRHRGTLSCADRASEGEAHSHLSCVRMVTVPSLGGGLEAKNILFFCLALQPYAYHHREAARRNQTRSKDPRSASMPFWTGWPATTTPGIATRRFPPAVILCELCVLFCQQYT